MGGKAKKKGRRTTGMGLGGRENFGCLLQLSITNQADG